MLSIFFCVYFSFACTSFYYWSTLSLSKVFHHHFCITYPRYFCHSVVCYTSIWLYNDDILIGLLHILFMRTPKMWKDGQELSVVCVWVCAFHFSWQKSPTLDVTRAYSYRWKIYLFSIPFSFRFWCELNFLSGSNIHWMSDGYTRTSLSFLCPSIDTHTHNVLRFTVLNSKIYKVDSEGGEGRKLMENGCGVNPSDGRSWTAGKCLNIVVPTNKITPSDCEAKGTEDHGNDIINKTASQYTFT